jgi:hypothetical protein
MRVYPTLHLVINENKEIACNTIGSAYKWTRETTQHYTWTHMKVKEQFVVRQWYGCKWTWEFIQHYTLTHIKVKERLVVRKAIDVKETRETIQHYT